MGEKEKKPKVKLLKPKRPKTWVDIEKGEFGKDLNNFRYKNFKNIEGEEKYLKRPQALSDEQKQKLQKYKEELKVWAKKKELAKQEKVNARAERKVRRGQKQKLKEQKKKVWEELKRLNSELKSI